MSLSTRSVTVSVYLCLLITLFAPVCYASIDSMESRKLPNIAIIGAGFGGASTSYYMRHLFGTNVNIDVYEKDKIGGRVANVEIGGREYEAGASIIHELNMYMVNLTEMFGLRKRDSNPGRLGIFDDKQLAFDGSRWRLIMVIQLMWRYGWDSYRLFRFIDKLIGDFSNIYDHQEAGRCFTTVENLLAAMSPRFVDLLQRSIADELRNKGFSERFIKELVTGGIRGNYGQDSTIHAFVGGVSIAGAGASLWSVKGGNKNVAEKLIENADVNVTNKRVARVARNDDGSFRLTTNGRHLGGTYDIVVIAAPLYSNVTGVDVSDVTSLRFPQKFHRTVATFVQGWPRTELFGVSNVNAVPEIVMTCGVQNYFNSLGRQTHVHFMNDSTSDSDLPIWKVFSNQPLNDDDLNKLFVSRKQMIVRDWLAYPSYLPPYTPVDKLPPFELAENVYFVNAFEMASSTMETSIIAGRNVALLAHERWLGRTELVDPYTASKMGGKEEL